MPFRSIEFSRPTHIADICTIFLQSEFSNVKSPVWTNAKSPCWHLYDVSPEWVFKCFLKYLPVQMQSRTGCFCLSFLLNFQMCSPIVCPFASSISDPICQVLYAIKICNCFGLNVACFASGEGQNRLSFLSPQKGHSRKYNGWIATKTQTHYRNNHRVIINKHCRNKNEIKIAFLQIVGHLVPHAVLQEIGINQFCNSLCKIRSYLKLKNILFEYY